MKTLQIGQGFGLPLDFVTQTQAILAKRGAGKSYCASVQAEEMLEAGQQVVVVDPTGSWWGLKSSADGKHPGFPITVFGGEHPDVRLKEDAGEYIAAAIVKRRCSAILDLSLLRKGEMTRFMGPFLEGLYRLNREAMHLIVDEADAIAPQRPFSEEARTLGAMEDVVRRGRKRGIGCTMISQRPAVLNKNVLTQAQILCALRLVHPKDIDAIKEWIDVHGDQERAKEMISSLPSLPIGTAWFWSPGWGDIFTKVKIRERKTFDSSATPEVGKSPLKAAVLAPVDIEKLGEEIQGMIEGEKANDPQALRRRILELEKQVRDAPIKADAESLREIHALKERIRQLLEHIKVYQGIFQQMKTEWASVLLKAEKYRDFKPPEDPLPPNMMVFKSLPDISPRRPPIEPRGTNPGKLRAGAERMLAALVQWYPSGMKEGQMRSHAGLRKSGTFSTYLSDLRTGGFIELREGEIFATQAGRDYFGGNLPPAPSNTEEVLAVWEPKLREGARRILRVLINQKRREIPLEELAIAAGLTKSGTFSTYLSDLRTARLISTGGGRASVNKDTLFL